MKKIIVASALMFISACSSNPFEKTDTIYDSHLLNKNQNTTHIRVHRVSQITGSALGSDCPLVLKVDEVETVGLQQNQYVDLYLSSGDHILSIRFKCALTAWRKSINLTANGKYQEYSAESGSAGQYRMLRIK
ncbi:hypothetical protein [Pantoea rwandensis]|uniref:hypothetical protein n=1 Tax=Pantoea rwandensis TaxID=1076550 RepID=UPI00111C5A63|nr:hypothetical protein [Pantoea rwandensis]